MPKQTSKITELPANKDTFEPSDDLWPAHERPMGSTSADLRMGEHVASENAVARIRAIRSERSIKEAKHSKENRKNRLRQVATVGASVLALAGLTFLIEQAYDQQESSYHPAKITRTSGHR